MQPPPEALAIHPTPVAQQSPATDLQENASERNRLEPATPVENSNRYDLATPVENDTRSAESTKVASRVVSHSSAIVAPAPKLTAAQRSSASITSRETPPQVAESAGRATAPAKASQQVTTAYGRTVKPTDKALGPK